jgi:hypothetical protein
MKKKKKVSYPALKVPEDCRKQAFYYHVNRQHSAPVYRVQKLIIGRAGIRSIGPIGCNLTPRLRGPALMGDLRIVNL